MSPEMQNGTAVGTASDVWGAGIVFACILKLVLGLDELMKFGSPYLTVDDVHNACKRLQYDLCPFFDFG